MNKPHDHEDISEHIARDDEAKAAGAREAEARIVRWLRRFDRAAFDDVPADIAARIERGEHLL